MRPFEANTTLRLDAGLFGEGGEQRIDQSGLAIGVDVDLARGTRGMGRGEARDGEHGGTGRMAHESADRPHRWLQ